MKPRLLDLFSGAGGAGVGYSRAGFDVVGVDNRPMPRYPFEFHQADALEYLAGHGCEFDVIHASPPCQRYSAMSSCRPGLSGDYPDLVQPTRELLDTVGRPYILENVTGSPLRPHLILCGHMFGLKLYRHRIFETAEFLWQPAHPQHLIPGSRAGHWEPGQIVSVSGNCSPIGLAREAMGIGWMTRTELAEAIPPAYTEFIGSQIVDQIRAEAAA